MNWKKLIKLFCIPVWVMIILVLLSTAAMIFTFIGGYKAHPLAYVTYIVSSYTLTAVVIKSIEVIPKQFRSAKKKVYTNPVGEKLMTDIKFRTHITLNSSLGINLIYITINVISGFLYNTIWFFVLALYYAILAIMRFLLVRFVNHTGIGNDYFNELRRSRLCGFILLTVNLALSGAVLMILYRNKGFEYNGILIYVMAIYTFYITTIAIVNLIKYRKFGSPVMSMSKIINMVAALVSMLSLETAMFSQFGKNMSPENQRLMIMLTGAGVSFIIVTLSVCSIINNSKKIKRIMEDKNHAEQRNF